MYDFHMHTKNSVDSKQTIDEICASAIEKGLRGIAVCDHVDMWFYHNLGTYDAIQTCISEVKAAKEKYGDRLEIFQGVEMAEYLYDAENAKILLNSCDWDVVLGSVHSVRFEEIDDSYSRIDFSTMAKEKIITFLREYFAHVMEMIEETDFDVLTHLTCPLRYINGKYDRNIDVLLFEKEIRAIFARIIEKRIALEVNTSGVGDRFGELMPSIPLLALYREMGGELLTIGSDAHVPHRVGNAIADTKDILRKLGFSTYCYYRNRKAQFIVL